MKNNPYGLGARQIAHVALNRSTQLVSVVNEMRPLDARLVHVTKIASTSACCIQSLNRERSRRRWRVPTVAPNAELCRRHHNLAAKCRSMKADSRRTPCDVRPCISRVYSASSGFIVLPRPSFLTFTHVSKNAGFFDGSNFA